MKFGKIEQILTKLTISRVQYLLVKFGKIEQILIKLTISRVQYLLVYIVV